MIPTQPQASAERGEGVMGQNQAFDAWTILNEQGDIWTQHIFDHPEAAESYKRGKGIDKHTVTKVRVLLTIVSPASPRLNPKDESL